jgi:hypothetical protein
MPYDLARQTAAELKEIGTKLTTINADIKACQALLEKKPMLSNAKNMIDLSTEELAAIVNKLGELSKNLE